MAMKHPSPQLLKRSGFLLKTAEGLPGFPDSSTLTIKASPGLIWRGDTDARYAEACVKLRSTNKSIPTGKINLLNVFILISMKYPK
jgi:hypothetical protein